MFSVIFDMDGTLLDTQKICVPAWEYAGRNQGVRGVGEAIKYVCGMNQTGWSNYLKEHYPTLDLERFIAEMRQYIIDNLVVKFMPGAKELLDYLKRNNIKIGLASGSSRGSVNHHLKEVSAETYFDAIVAGDEIENGKPAPDIFLETAKKMGAHPKDCFVFEDADNGIFAGHKAGMKCIGVPDMSEFSPEAEKLMYAKISRLSDAIEIFESLQNT